MRYVDPKTWPQALAAYLFGGALIGAALPYGQAWCAAHLGRGGIAVAIVVNLAMPALIVALAAWRPRVWVALLGAFLATAALLVTATRTIPVPTRAFIESSVRGMGPVLVVAIVAYHVLAVITVFAVSPWRRVGVAPPDDGCKTCGYSQKGLMGERCPECGSERAATPSPRSKNPCP